MTRSKIAEKITEQTPQEVKDEVKKYGDDLIAVNVYKVALREAIEKEMAIHQDVISNGDDYDDMDILSASKFVRAFKKALELIDTVTPDGEGLKSK